MFGAMFGDQTLVITSISKKGNDDKFMRSCDVRCRPPEAPLYVCPDFCGFAVLKMT